MSRPSKVLEYRDARHGWVQASYQICEAVAETTLDAMVLDWPNSYRWKPEPLTDVKAALHSGIKPDITHVRTPLLNYVARSSEYGTAKYKERANYVRPTTSQKEDFERYRSYLRALVSHTYKVLDSMERHQAGDPQLQDWSGMKAAAYAADTDPGNDRVGPSQLSHIGGAAASINMALEQAVNCGLLPADPGQPWNKK